MKHYDRSEWEAYKKQTLDVPQINAMEEHLLDCASCLALFLNLVEDHEIEEAGFFIPEDFGQRVLTAARSIKPLASPPVSKPSRVKPRSNLLVAYASAAVITLFLAGNGFFTGLTTVASANASVAAPSHSPFCRLENQKQGLIDEWSKQLETNEQRIINAIPFHEYFIEGVNQ